MLRDDRGAITTVHDRHVEGVFPRATWLRILKDVGFEPHRVPFAHSEVPPGSYEGFVGVRPGG